MENVSVPKATTLSTEYVGNVPVMRSMWLLYNIADQLVDPKKSFRMENVSVPMATT